MKQLAASISARHDPNVEVLFGLIALQRDMKTFENMASLCRAVKQGAQVHLVFSSIEHWTIWTEEHARWLRHLEPPSTKEGKPCGDSGYRQRETGDCNA